MEVEGESFDEGTEFSEGDSATVAGVISDVLISVGDALDWIICRSVHFGCGWLTSRHSPICLWK